MDEDDLLGADYAHEQDLRWQLQRGSRNQGEGYKGRRVEGAGNHGLVQGDYLNNLDFRESKSTESKCNKTVVDHITQIPVEYHIHTTIISEYK